MVTVRGDWFLEDVDEGVVLPPFILRRVCGEPLLPESSSE